MPAIHNTMNVDYMNAFLSITSFILYGDDENLSVVGVVSWLEMSCRAHLRASLDRHCRGHR